MSPPSNRSNTTHRWCWLLCLGSLSLIAGRMATVRSATGEVPFLSANDRSRWATVSSLVDRHTFDIDYLQSYRDPITKRRTWQTIDRVQHRDAQGVLHSYSSKPPLFPTLIAIPYAILKSITGWSIVKQPFLVGRILLALVNLPLLAILFASTISIIQRYRLSPWSTIFLTAMITCGTLVPPFAITLNNHLPAAASVALGLWLLDSQARFGATWLKMLLTGLCIAFSVANELPSLALAPLWILFALRIRALRFRSSLAVSAVALLAGILLVAIPFFATNYIAHRSLRPPYAHRNLGQHLDSLDLSIENIDDVLDVASPAHSALLSALSNKLSIPTDQITLAPARLAQVVRADTPDKTFAIKAEATKTHLHLWDDWYDYPGTYWSDANRKGIDRGEPSRMLYAFHAMIGHHGVFSLTPMWLLSVLGTLLWLQSRSGTDSRTSLGQASPADTTDHPHSPGFPKQMAAALFLVTLVCTFFYLSRPQIDRNYGGVSVAFRWLIWMAPLWIFLAIPAVERLSASRLGRIACTVLLAASLLSVGLSLQNPWSHPWLYRWMDDLGWIAQGTDR
jgi:hypothetical protein